MRKTGKPRSDRHGRLSPILPLPRGKSLVLDDPGAPGVRPAALRNDQGSLMQHKHNDRRD